VNKCSLHSVNGDPVTLFFTERTSFLHPSSGATTSMKWYCEIFTVVESFIGTKRIKTGENEAIPQAL